MHAEVLVVLAQVARVQAQPTRALELLEHSRSIAADVGHGWAWASSLWMMAKVRMDGADGVAALHPLREMLRITLADRDATSTLAALLVAVGALTAAGRPRDAAVLLGALDAASDRIGYYPGRMDPVDGAGYIAAAKQALDTTAYDAAYAEGRALSLDAAADLVLRGDAAATDGGFTH